VSKRLTDSAVCLVNDSALDRNLERLLSRQQDSGVSISAPVLEINPSHTLIQALTKSNDVSDAAHLLLDQAFILEGEQVVDPADFAKRLGEVMAKAFS
jgi:molecular chaperone HtpG